MNKKNVMLASVILIVFFGLVSCHRQETHQASQTITVASAPMNNRLFYTGIIRPLRTIVVPSPVEGVVVDMPFQYGDEVKSGQWLFMLSSTKFTSDYKSALTQYVKAKSEFANTQTQLTEGKFLHHNQLISDDDFKLKQANFYAARLALMQARDALETLLKQLNIRNINLNELSIADIDAINKAMHLQKAAENLHVLAPVSGVVLSTLKSDEDNKKLHKGELVKEGDVLAVIGDLSGIAIQVKVNELTINQIKVGQKVKVTGIAFPEYELSGEIQSVDRQGESSASGLPNFPVQVIVPHLTPAEQQYIHVGMSAKVEITIDETTHIAIPMTAVYERSGKFFVDIIDQKTGKPKPRSIKTGKTTAMMVAVLDGLHVGDKIVAH